MSESKGVYKVGESENHPAFLSVPGAEVIIRSPDGAIWKLEELAQVLAKAAAANPDKQCEFWVKLLP